MTCATTPICSSCAGTALIGGADRWLADRDAFGHYEGNWRFVDAEHLSDRERSLIERLAAGEINFAREVVADRYGIRTFIEVDDQKIKQAAWSRKLPAQ